MVSTFNVHDLLSHACQCCSLLSKNLLPGGLTWAWCVKMDTEISMSSFPACS
uniref:Uncharacterized protein n=1 Tax=Rhizophora mucronata TaxID=61149 RepID=A0A2P2PPD7_RHIMU